MDCFVAALLAMTKDASIVIAIPDLFREKQSMAQRKHFQPTVYMMANHKGGTIYVGVTSDLVQRAWQHREGKVALIEADNSDWRDLFFEIAG